MDGVFVSVELSAVSLFFFSFHLCCSVSLFVARVLVVLSLLLGPRVSRSREHVGPTPAGVGFAHPAARSEGGGRGECGGVLPGHRERRGA